MPAAGRDAVFGALADPTRRELVEHLSAGGPMTATELARAYPVSRQAVTKHLRVLAAAGVLGTERHGREVRYAVRPEQLEPAVHWLAEVGARWDRRLAALQRHLDGMADC